MPITLTTGNIFEESAEAIVNTVNCVGVMGKGLAFAFKKEFPREYSLHYEKACRAGEVRLGRMHLYEYPRLDDKHPGLRFIINFPTKRHWRNDSRLEDIQAGLDDLRQCIIDREIRSIAIPALGSNLGNLDWPTVRAEIGERLGDLPQQGVDVTVYAPHDWKPKVKKVDAAILRIVAMLSAEDASSMVNERDVHEMMYLLERISKPLGLGFQYSSAGVHSDRVSARFDELESRYLKIDRVMQIVPGATADTDGVIAASAELQEQLQKLEKVLGSDPHAGLPLLLAVLQISNEQDPEASATRDDATYAEAATNRIAQAVSERNPALKKSHIKATVKRLRQANVLPAAIRLSGKSKRQTDASRDSKSQEELPGFRNEGVDKG